MINMHYGNVVSHEIHKGINGLFPDAADFSETDTLTLLENNAEPDYISFDGLGIDLDVRYKTFINNCNYIGYCSSISDENCNISSWIYLGNNNLTKSPITIKFNGDCCRELVVEFTYPDTHSEHVYIDCDKELLVIQPPSDNVTTFFEEYYSVRITFLKTAVPNQRVKIAYIKFGEMIELSDFKSTELLEEIDVLSADLPMNSLSFSAVFPKEAELKDGNTINVYSNGKYYGTFYLEDYQKISKDIYQISAYNSISILDNTEFKNWKSIIVSANDFLTEIENSSEIGFVSGEDLSEISVYGHLPISTNRVALCGYCFAANLMIDSSRNDKIALRNIPTKITSVITNESKRIIGDAVFTKSKPITSAEYKYPISDTLEEIEIKAGNAADEYTILIFEDAPVIILSHLGNIAIYEESLNHIAFESEESGTVFEAQKINLHYAIEEIPNLDIMNSNAKRNLLKFDNFNLLSTSPFPLKKESISKYIQSKGTVKAKIILNGEKVGDLITIETAYDGIVTGIITSMNIHFGYQDTADIEVLEWEAG